MSKAPRFSSPGSVWTQSLYSFFYVTSYDIRLHRVCCEITFILSLPLLSAPSRFRPWARHRSNPGAPEGHCQQTPITCAGSPRLQTRCCGGSEAVAPGCLAVLASHPLHQQAGRCKLPEPRLRLPGQTDGVASAPASCLGGGLQQKAFGQPQCPSPASRGVRGGHAPDGAGS